MDVRKENEISNEDKKMIIEILILAATGNENDFSTAKRNIKEFKSLSNARLNFIDEVYELIQESEIKGGMEKGENRRKLKEELYQKLQITPEAIQEQKEDTRNSQEPYKKELYRPDLLCRHPKLESDKPFVQLVREPKEREECVVHSYQFAGRNYDIRKRGELFYMSTPNLRESVSEYEITITTEKGSKTIRVFGEISIDRMREPNYNTMIFLQLLGVTNLTDKELHGYIGSLEQLVRPDGTKKNEYRIAHLPEEYTAVLMWEEKEREQIRGQAQLNHQEKPVINLETRKENEPDKVAGGDER